MDKNLEKSENDINYSVLIERARNCLNQNAYFDSLFNCNLALVCPNLDQNSKMNIFAVASYIYLNQKNDSMVLNLVKKCFKYSKKNKRSYDDELNHCLVRIINRGGQLFYPGIKHYNYLAAFFFYYSKQIYSDLGLRNEDDRRTLDKRFEDVYNQIDDEVSINL